ncbi:MAG: hypothetical protein ACD_3C00205G0003 [uncultured bacterium (gcode 4)]|uniref:Uncharacterized protein n=1 Tax=uncultured bacterium (gcode 4) TaxID=1234023 RepID=K2GVS9_9BACT|nr:MAG: hypothetical protein ACD_3C00205G0003 [uncultured bacterium (gcode 4)]
MLTVQQARELSQEKRLEIARWLVSKKVEAILDKEILVAIATHKFKVSVVLKASICRDDDDKIRGYLAALGYEDIKVTSDFPWYNESYEWSTDIKFSVPR